MKGIENGKWEIDDDERKKNHKIARNDTGINDE